MFPVDGSIQLSFFFSFPFISCSLFFWPFDWDWDCIVDDGIKYD